MSILDQIANPQMADIVGALDVRQQRLERDEAKRKEIRMGQLIAEALPNIKEGSPLYEIATTNPSGFAAFAKAIGIPLNAGERMQEFADDTEMLYMLAQRDPREAMEYAMEVSEQRKEAGRDSPQMDRFIAGMREDPMRTMTGLFTVRRSLNQGRSDKPAGLVEFEGMTEGFSEEDKLKAKRIAAGLDPRAQGSADITIANEGLTDVVATSKGKIAGTVKGSESTAKENVSRAQDFINRGVAAAEGLPSVNRGIELLDIVETGGFDKAAILAKQAIGVESANEGELTYNLGKSVLSQLRETFGAAFTQEEGKRLADLEAGLGRSPATNKRILAQVKQIMESKAKRGKQAAIDQGDDFTASDIDRFMNMSLAPKGGSGEGAMTPGIAPKEVTENTAGETAAQRFARLKGGN